MKLAVIGCGKMGSALVKGMVQSGVINPAELIAADVHPAARQQLVAAIPGAVEAADNARAMREADVLLLCVKPTEVESVLKPLAQVDDSKLIVSVAAGVTLQRMEVATAGKHRIVRVMPNTPAMIGKGAAAFALGNQGTQADAALVEKMLGATGLVVQVPEKLLDAVTGLSGSGPAYVYTVIEALADGGLLMGLSKDQALKLAAQTVLGAAAMVLETGMHPAVLRDQVTSPGGTTIAGLAKLEQAGVRSTLIEAVRAATLRSKELGA